MVKRPNLVNPSLWSPFRSIPEIPSTPIGTFIQVPPPTPAPIEIEVPRPISRRELVQRNSFYLNLFCLIIILGIGYFLYSIYLERKIFADYLNYIKDKDEEHYPGFL